MSFYFRRLDHITVSLGTVRTACQILNDATLIAYYPFNTVDTLSDRSVSLCNGIAGSVSTVSNGFSGEALLFSSSASYFQAQCFSTVRLLDPAFTVSIWIYPNDTITGGSLIHLSTGATGNGTCHDMLVFTSTGTLVMQWINNGGTVVSAIQGPQISINTWTHIAAVFSPGNGGRLYINGQLFVYTTSTGSLSYYDYQSQMYMTVGNISPLGATATITCNNGSIPIEPGAYKGMIDELRLYNRELNSQEICVLANL